MKSKKNNRLELSPSEKEFIDRIRKRKDFYKKIKFPKENPKEIPLPETYNPFAACTYVKADYGSIVKVRKKESEMLPDHIHSEIEAALAIFDERFLRNYSKNKIKAISWNKHGGDIIAPLDPIDGEISIIEYKFADELLKKTNNNIEELTARIISDNILEAVMKICLYAKDM